MAKIRELRSIIYGKYDSESQFAKELGWKKQRLNKITNGKKEPDVVELNALASALGISVDSIAQIFLRSKSPNRQQTTPRNPAA